MEIEEQQWDDETEYLWSSPDPEMSQRAAEPF